MYRTRKTTVRGVKNSRLKKYKYELCRPGYTYDTVSLVLPSGKNHEYCNGTCELNLRSGCSSTVLYVKNKCKTESERFSRNYEKRNEGCKYGTVRDVLP